MNKNKLTQILNKVASHQAHAGNWYFHTFGDASLEIAKCCMEWESGVDNPGSNCHHPNVPHFSVMCSPRFGPSGINIPLPANREKVRVHWPDGLHWGWFDWSRSGSTNVDDLLYIQRNWGKTFRPANLEGWYGG